MLSLSWGTLTLLVLLAVWVAASWRRHREHFSRRAPKAYVCTIPPLPLLGNMARVFFKLEHVSDDIDRFYKGFPGQRFVGKFEFLRPVVMIKDLDLLKKIFIKDFDHFSEHRAMVDSEVDPLFGRSLFNLRGKEWKDMRSTLTPVFTSSKLKMLVPFMETVGQRLRRHLTQKIESSSDKYIDVDIKDLTFRYGNDVMASVVFGLNVDSFSHKPCQFSDEIHDLLQITFKHLFLYLANSSFPKLIKALKITFFKESARRYIKGLVMSVLAERREKKTIRPDVIHLMMEIKKGNLKNENVIDEVDCRAAPKNVDLKGITKEWTDDDIASQAATFILGGAETVSTTMSFLLHELSMYPDVQDRLAKEILNHAASSSTLDYYQIQSLPYLDMVVAETLRLWPPGPFLDRDCTKDYNLGKANDESQQDYIIRKGEGVLIPLWGLHRDPQYFPDPMKFVPERFSEENKHENNFSAYMPFGVGPRNCIASRYAICQIKVLTYMVIQRVKLEPSSAARLRLCRDAIALRLPKGHFVRCSLRK